MDGQTQLRMYFERIGFEHEPGPTLETLALLLERHALSVTFENLDVQLGTPLTTSTEEAFDKIVRRRRGGWCYEQNGIFGHMLEHIGFGVTRLAAHVMRADRGMAVAANNHLSLLVTIPDVPGKRWLADVGFGGSMLQPLELIENSDIQPPFEIGLRILDDGHWQFWENAGEDDFSFDFLAEPGDEAALSAKCAKLQTDPSSSFVKALVAQRRWKDRRATLRGRVLSTVDSSGTQTETVASADQLVQILRDVFRLDVPGVASLWPRVVARHDAYLAELASRHGD